MSVEALDDLCVAPFATSASRPRLMAALVRLVTALAASVPTCDVWVDGSFVTALDKTFQTHRDWTVNRTYEAVIHSDVTTRYSTGEETTKYRLESLKSVD